MILIVLKIGADTLDDPEMLRAFLTRFSQLPSPKILVHGGGKLASRFGLRLGIEEKYVGGRRITDDSTLELVTMVYGGLINKNLVAQLEHLHCPAVGLCGADGSSIVASRRVVREVDYGYAGDIERDKMDTKLLDLCIDNGISPVFSSLSLDPAGSLLNTNGDSIASALAIKMAARFSVKLIYCTSTRGVLNECHETVPTLSEAAIEPLIRSGVIHAGMIPKLHYAVEALKNGVADVHILRTNEVPSTFSGTGLPGTKITLND